MTLSALTTLTGLDVFDYLDKEVSIPVVDGLQAQGDLIVIPFSLLANIVTPLPWTRSVDVPLSGVELLRSAAGGNPHSLVADVGECAWSTPVKDARGLALGVLDTQVTAYLIHPSTARPESLRGATSSDGSRKGASGVRVVRVVR
ncbi:hypothetical protein GCM10020255_057630 [Rhodococcus baikonurensis]